MADLKPAAQRALCDLFYEEDGQWFVGAAPHSNVTGALKPVLAALGLPVEYPPDRDDLEQAEMLALDHSPLIIQVRKGHVGEKAYRAMWEATMAPPSVYSSMMEPWIDEGLPIERVLRNMPGPITQRHASVLASVAMWLGTACGCAMLKHAERLRDSLAIHHADAYLVAWTLENRRTSWVNSGGRTVEMLLGRRLEVTAGDLETIDHFMRWLAEAEGQKFLERAERLEQQHSKEDAIMRRAEMNMAAASGGAP